MEITRIYFSKKETYKGTFHTADIDINNPTSDEKFNQITYWCGGDYDLSELIAMVENQMQCLLTDMREDK